MVNWRALIRIPHLDGRLHEKTHIEGNLPPILEDAGEGGNGERELPWSAQSVGVRTRPGWGEINFARRFVRSV